MNNKYTVGYPFWRLFARYGYTLRIRVDVVRDYEAGYYVATSQDLRGLVCEAETMDVITDEIRRAANVLLLLSYEPKPAPSHFIELIVS